MQISFHHANPDAGNESFLLRLDTGDHENPCVLIDAGQGVDLGPLLKPGDNLGAVCLTHAHLDHYAELSSVHETGVPILTSPATAKIMGDVFEVANREYDVTTTAAISDAITATEEWVTVAPEIDIHPVPAGHVPGAVGFLIRVWEDDRCHHILATGDFTQRRAGGFPGFDVDGFVDIDVLFLTGATSDTFESSITEALGTALERAQGGAPTLVPTSGLVGVQCAYLLSVLSEEYDLQVPVRVVGQAAKLYDALDYECTGVETIPEFTHTDECIEPGAVIIAGPEIPSERSSGRLFGVLRENSSACVIQLVGSGAEPLTDARCTVHAYDFINHPTRESLIETHDRLEPTQTVIVHRHGGALSSFNDLTSTVWGAGDTDEYILYDEGSWPLPPWMAGGHLRNNVGRSVRKLVGSDLLGSFPVPSLDHHEEPDLEAEGIDVKHIERILHRGPGAATSADAPSQAVNQPESEPINKNDISMASDSSDSTDTDETPANTQAPKGLVRTTGSDLGDDLDPQLQSALEAGTISEKEVDAVRKLSELIDEAGYEEVVEGIAKVAQQEGPEATIPSTQSPTEAVIEAEQASADLSDREQPESSSPDSSPEETGESEQGTNRETSANLGPEEEAEEGPSIDEDEQMDSINDSSEEETISLNLNPLAVTIAERAVSEGGDNNSGEVTTDDWILEAVDEYVIALLSGEATGRAAERFQIDVEASDMVERLVDELLEEELGPESASELIAEGIASTLMGEVNTVREIPGLIEYQQHLEAIISNEAYVFSEPEELVEAAMTWHYLSRDAL